MPFDLVAHVRELPYLVLTTLFAFLPADTAALYCQCDHPEIRVLARLRRWHKVVVGGVAPEANDVLLAVFERVVRTNTPPPCHIQFLKIVLGRNQFSLVPAWAAYLKTHAVYVSFEVVLNSGQFMTHHPSLVECVPNLTSLTFVHGLSDYLFDHPIETLRFPESLRTLLIGEHERGAVPYRNLAIPESVTTLRLRCLHESPEELPVFPAELRELVLWGMEVIDFTPFVQHLPERLGVLQTSRYDSYRGKTIVRPCTILAATAKLLPPLLQLHNLYVVDGEVLEAGYMEQTGNGGWRLIVDGETNYLRYHPPLGVEELEIVTEAHVRPSDVFSQLLPRLPALRLLQVTGVAMVRFRVQQQQIPHLATLRLHRCTGVAKCDWSIAENVTGLSMTLCQLRGIPAAIGKCTRLTELDLGGNSLCVAGLDTLVFPSTLKRLVLSNNAGTPPKPTKRRRTNDEAAATGTTVLGLRNLGQLERLEVMLCKLKTLCDLELPDSLLALKASLNQLSKTKLEEVRLPPRLQVLELSYSGIRNPWSLALPSSIRKLNLLGNALAPPPTDYTYPAALETLLVGGCKIKSLARFRIPEGVLLEQ